MKKFRTSKLYHYAMKYIEDPHPQEDRELAKIDMTEYFYDELEKMLINKEHINININAPVRKGKSTVNIALGKHIQDLMIKLKISKNRFTIWNIARTQYELSMKMKDPRLNNVFIAIDENDDLESTGENATVDEALLKNFSKVQAGRYIHRGYCSPSDIPDEGSDIILQIIQPNKETFITHCRLYYRVLKGANKYMQLLGYVNISVKDVVWNWVTKGIEDKFYSKNKSKKDEKFLNKWRKKDFYTEYMCRKFEKMDLINEKGIFRTKEIDYSDIFVEAIEQLEPLTRCRGTLNSRMVKNYVKSLCKKYKIPTSIIGDQLMSDRVEGILDMMKSYYENIERIKRLRKVVKDPHKTNNQAIEEMKNLQEVVSKLGEIIEMQKKELRELKELKTKYYEKDDEEEGQ